MEGIKGVEFEEPPASGFSESHTKQHLVYEGVRMEVGFMDVGDVKAHRSIQHLKAEGSRVHLLAKGATYIFDTTSPHSPLSYRFIDAENMVCLKDVRVFFSTNMFPQVWRMGEQIGTLASVFTGGNTNGASVMGNSVLYVSSGNQLIEFSYENILQRGHHQGIVRSTLQVRDFFVSQSCPLTILTCMGVVERSGKDALELYSQYPLKKWEWYFLGRLKEGFVVNGFSFGKKTHVYVVMGEALDITSSISSPLACSLFLSSHSAQIDAGSSYQRNEQRYNSRSPV